MIENPRKIRFDPRSEEVIAQVLVDASRPNGYGTTQYHRIKPENGTPGEPSNQPAGRLFIDPRWLAAGGITIIGFTIEIIISKF